jgi:hypothetical protein
LLLIKIFQPLSPKCSFLKKKKKKKKKEKNKNPKNNRLCDGLGLHPESLESDKAATTEKMLKGWLGG